MPLYEYECRKCHHRFERIQKFSDKPVRRCPECKTGRVDKLVSSPAVHFKGTGWYVTDYAGKGKDKGAGSAEGGKSEDGKSEGGARSEGAGKSESDRKSDKGQKAAAARDSSSKGGSGSRRDKD